MRQKAAQGLLGEDLSAAGLSICCITYGFAEQRLKGEYQKA